MKTIKITGAVVAAICLISTLAFSASDDRCNADLDEYLNCNNQRVMKYLTALTKKDVGKVIDGVRLTDGDTVLKGHTFLGEAKGMGKGVRLFIFKYKRNHVAYLWVEQNGAEFDLPDCPKSVSDESAYVLSGDVYTWKAAHPGDGVIETPCVKEEWLKKANRPR